MQFDYEKVLKNLEDLNNRVSALEKKKSKSEVKEEEEKPAKK